MKNIFLSLPNLQDIDVFAILENKKIINVIGALIFKNNLTYFKNKFPKIKKIFVFEFILYNGIEGKFNNLDHSILDFEYKKLITKNENLIFYMIERISLGRILTFTEKYNLIKYTFIIALKYLKDYKPKYFYSRNTPHEVIDFLFYLVFKNEKINILKYVRCFHDKLYFLTNDYKWPWKNLSKSIILHKKKNKVIFDIELSNYHKQIKGKKYFKPQYLENVEKLENNSKIIKLKKILSKTFYNIKHLFFDNLFFTNILFKIITRISINSNFKQLQKKKKLYFKEIKKYPKKFIYFLLPFNPENTTSPESGDFWDIFFTLGLISKNIPNDYKILVKEHPAQLIKSDKWYGFLGRDINFYERLKSIPKIELIDTKDDMHIKTIDNSIAVSCLNGTVGWEAIIRGKKVIVFGEAFYCDNKLALRIKNKKDLKKINFFLNKNISNYEKNNIAFINAICAIGIKSFFSKEHAKSNGYDFDYNKEIVKKTDYLINFFKKNK